MEHRLAIIAKNAPKRIVTAWANIVENADGSPVVDAHNDIIPFDELEAAFAKAFAHGGLGRGEEQHVRFELADVIGQITLSRDERRALGFGEGPAGAIVKIRVHDDALWQRIMAGELPELSIRGRGVRHDVPDVMRVG